MKIKSKKRFILICIFLMFLGTLSALQSNTTIKVKKFPSIPKSVLENAGSCGLVRDMRDYQKEKLITLSDPRASKGIGTLPHEAKWCKYWKTEGEMVELSYQWENGEPSQDRIQNLKLVLVWGGRRSFLRYGNSQTSERKSNLFFMGNGKIRFWVGAGHYDLWGSKTEIPASKGFGYCLYAADAGDLDKDAYDKAVTNIIHMQIFGPIKFDSNY